MGEYGDLSTVWFSLGFGELVIEKMITCEETKKLSLVSGFLA